jgi:hypothetical protein
MTTSTTTGASTAPSTFSFGGRSAKVGAIKDDTKLGEIKPEEAAEGQRQIVFIHRVQQEYETRCSKPIEGEEAFDARLVQVDRAMQRALDQTLPGLATEHDRSCSELAEFSEQLLAAKNDFKAASFPSRADVCPFLQRFVEQLQQRSAILKASLDAIDPPKTADDGREPMTADVSALVRMLARQSTAILCVSARIAQLDARSQAIGDKLRNLNRGMPFSELVSGAESWHARTTKMYKEYREERIRRLNKRNKDPAQYKDPPKAAGFGSSFGSFLRTPGTATTPGGTTSGFATAGFPKRV